MPSVRMKKKATIQKIKYQRLSTSPPNVETVRGSHQPTAGASANSPPARKITTPKTAAQNLCTLSLLGSRHTPCAVRIRHTECAYYSVDLNPILLAHLGIRQNLQEVNYV